MHTPICRGRCAGAGCRETGTEIEWLKEKFGRAGRQPVGLLVESAGGSCNQVTDSSISVSEMWRSAGRISRTTPTQLNISRP